MMKRTAGFLLAALAAFALIVPAAALAATSHAPGDTTWITGAKVPVAPWQSQGWAYYCPAAYPYLTLQGANGPDNPGQIVCNNDSDSGVTVSLSPATDAFTGKLDVDYMNWNFLHANGQVSYECSTQPPNN
jgi:hypothetical protein